jgi:DNA polymerase I-like protein with 3'-5' exonuclease and polymerase domains
MLQSYVIESDKGHDLGQLCTRHLGLATIAYEDLCGKGAKQITFDQVDIERAAVYAAEDSDVTLRVHNVLHRNLPMNQACRASTMKSRCPSVRSSGRSSATAS